MRPFSFERDRPVVAWHRGASDRALENSPAAFRLAAEEGADLVECDVRLTADGAPAVFHDARTGRTAKENVDVARTPAARMSKVRLKNGEPVPLLPDVLDLLRGRVPLNIESKAAGGMASVRRALLETAYAGEILLSSSLREECLAARDLMPGLPCGLVTRRPSASDVAFCRGRSLASIHPDHRTLTVLRIARVRREGLRLVPYTVNDEGAFFRLVEAGADGVFSDRARDLREAWRERHRAG